MSRILIEGGRVIDPSQNLDRVTNLLVDGSNARQGPASALVADADVRHAFLGG